MPSLTIRKDNPFNPNRNRDTFLLKEIYSILQETFGKSGWWPAETPLEVTIGAILTQNTNWGNVERSIQRLKSLHLLDSEKLRHIAVNDLALQIRSSGYYNLKAKRLKAFVDFLWEEYEGKIELLARDDNNDRLRQSLLRVKGIGPETCDSILLYACNKPFFVVDLYTKRILSRHRLISPEAGYEEIQAFFTSNLPKDLEIYREYHAYIVTIGKTYCKKKIALCSQCPVVNLFPA